MKIEALSSDETVLAELGSRLARTRLERNVSQEQLAREAGVSRNTVEKIESGRSVRVVGLLRVLRALGLLEALDRLVPEPLPSPIERVRRQGRRRQRARPRPEEEEPGPWRWGDAADGSSPPDDAPPG